MTWFAELNPWIRLVILAGVVALVIASSEAIVDIVTYVDDDPYGNYEHSTGKMIKASRSP